MRVAAPFLLILFLLTPLSSLAEDVIVYTANQEWLSRICLLRMDGSVLDYFEYSFYRFVDTEVVDNELYVAAAFAQRRGNT